MDEDSNILLIRKVSNTVSKWIVKSSKVSKKKKNDKLVGRTKTIIYIKIKKTSNIGFYLNSYIGACISPVSLFVKCCKNIKVSNIVSIWMVKLSKVSKKESNSTGDAQAPI